MNCQYCQAPAPVKKHTVFSHPMESLGAGAIICHRRRQPRSSDDLCDECVKANLALVDACREIAHHEL